MSGKPPSPRLCSTVLVWRKDPRRGAHSRCMPQHRLAVDKEQPLAAGRGGGARGLCSLPGPSSASFLALGRREQGAAPVAGGAGRGGGGAPGAGRSPSQRLAWSWLLLKWVRSLPCTNTGLSLAPPKYTESWRQSWPQYRLLGLCLLLPRRPGFHALPAARVGAGCRWLFPGKRLLLHQGPACCRVHRSAAPSSCLCPAGMLCPLCPLCPQPLPLCRSHSSVSSSPTAPSQNALGVCAAV